MTVTLDAFSGQTIYLDTILPYALLRGVDPAAKAFFDRVAHTVILPVAVRQASRQVSPARRALSRWL